LLHLPLKATQGVFERLAFLQSDFCQRNYTPKPVRLDSSVIARRARKVKHYMEFAGSSQRLSLRTSETYSQR
jgi:hypothetical protein